MLENNSLQTASCDEHKQLAEIPKRYDSVPTSLDQEMLKLQSKLQTRASEADIDLRRRVAISLIWVFCFTVLLSGLVILLQGFQLMTLPSEVIHLLIGSTIAQAVVLYKSVIADIFKNAESAGSKSSLG